MPELPEVETTRRGLIAVVKNATIERITVHRRDLRMPIPNSLEKELTGARITDITRRSKYLLFHVQRNQKKPKVMLVHLGMSGSVRLEKTGFNHKTHDHVIWDMGAHTQMVFHDPRRFGIITLLLPDEIATHLLLRHLGPEPLTKDFSAAYVRCALASKKAPIKTVLMDNTFVVGVGNIYASESLFACGVHPETPAFLLKKKVPELVRAIKKTLKSAIDSGGSTLRDYVQSTGSTGYFQHSFHVYGRAGESCLLCAQPIQHAVHAGRATYWCNQCQPPHLKRARQ